MAEFVTVARIGDVDEGRPKTVMLRDKLVALFLEGGHYYAIDDTCPHMGASLSEGFVENGVVNCSWHGWRFRLADGTWADSPRLKIGCYPVRVQGDEIQLQVDESPKTEGAP
jgi:nitrite reductase (NADH) small subunit/3-phenylpropionate/trans-cinnamate dioxygenase ferredoxin subunit